MKKSKLFPKPQETNSNRAVWRNGMNKPTIQIDPKSRVLSDAGAIQFAAACVEEAVRLENRGFAGTSLKLYTFNKEEIAEFHWQGMMVIRLIHRPAQDYPEKTYLDFPLFYRGEAQSWKHFRLQDCMIDAIDHRIKHLLDLRNNVAGDVGGKNLALMLNQMRPDLYNENEIVAKQHHHCERSAAILQ